MVAEASNAYLRRLAVCEEELRLLGDGCGRDLLGALVGYRGAVAGILLVAEELRAAVGR